MKTVYFVATDLAFDLREFLSASEFQKDIRPDAINVTLLVQFPLFMASFMLGIATFRAGRNFISEFFPISATPKDYPSTKVSRAKNSINIFLSIILFAFCLTVFLAIPTAIIVEIEKYVER